CGYALRMVPGLHPKRDRLEAEYAPAWEPKGRCLVPGTDEQPGHCIVIGSGLGGAAAAASLARRGWEVTVLDSAERPAAGASGLPAGLVLEHDSVHDSVLSRLSRAGVRATWLQVRSLLRQDWDYALSGVRERRFDGEGGEDGEGDRWHADAGWLKPAQLVQALLGQAGVRWQGRSAVQQLRQQGESWQALDAQGQVLAQAGRVVVCAGFGSHALLEQALPLQALRGQLSWGWRCAQGLDAADFPDTPVNGGGNFIPQVPTEQGVAWYLGSTFGRDDTDTLAREGDARSNYAKLQALLPATATALGPAFDQARVQAFTAVRCTTPDRLPVVGALDAQRLPGLWVSSAMGARGLTLAVLCGELLAALWHGEPLPLEKKLALALAPGRASLVRRSAARDRAPSTDAAAAPAPVAQYGETEVEEQNEGDGFALRPRRKAQT
ncbi:MAG: FAD-dependent oxidoreductase, partial [Betaproteobacteria bacterium]